VVNGSLAPPSSFDPALRKLDPMIARALSREPGERYPSVAALGAALDALGERGHAMRAAAVRTVPTERPATLVNDGLAVRMRGDAFVALWKAPARMDLLEWEFDIVDRFVAERPNGIVALIVLLPSSSPPNVATVLRIIQRIDRTRVSTRRQSTVALGGGVWLSVVQNVHDAITKHLTPGGARIVFSSTIQNGIARLLEMASPETPSDEAIREDLCALFEALDLDPPPDAMPASRRPLGSSP
jgi:hypothetical protein